MLHWWHEPSNVAKFVIQCCVLIFLVVAKDYTTPLIKSLMEFLKKLWYKLTNSKHRKIKYLSIFFWKFHLKGCMKGKSNHPKFGLPTKCSTNIVKNTLIWKKIEIETMGGNWMILAYYFQSMLLVCLMKLRSFDKYEKTWKFVPRKNYVRHWNVHK